MRAFDSSRCVLIIITAALLAACGESQPPISAPGTMPQSYGIAQHAERGGSWMLPEAKSEDLIYAADTHNYDVAVFSYPKGKLVGTVSYGDISAVCSDSNGNVFVPVDPSSVSQDTSYIYEYAHGGSQPIATLSETGYALGCSVDPATGNLAVTNGTGPLAVFQGAQGSATYYSIPPSVYFESCAYDDNGNLFLGNGGLWELPADSSTFEQITLNKDVRVIDLQWTSGSLAVSSNSGCTCRGPAEIYQVEVSGTNGTIVASTNLLSSRHGHGHGNGAAGQYWIQRNRIIGPGMHESQLYYWSYPAGGRPTKSIRRVGSYYGITVSVAPSR